MERNTHTRLATRVDSDFARRFADAARRDERSLSSALRLAAARYIAERESATRGAA